MGCDVVVWWLGNQLSAISYRLSGVGRRVLTWLLHFRTSHCMIFQARRPGFDVFNELSFIGKFPCCAI
jgi:hypothetical protein